MNDVRNIRISGLDETRPPRIRKQPYIDLFFELSEQAPVLWCELFNQHSKDGRYPAKIDPEKGLLIETWVRKPEEIEAWLASLKTMVAKTTTAYLARVKADADRARGQMDQPGDEGEQGRLNRIVAALDFSV